MAEQESVFLPALPKGGGGLSSSDIDADSVRLLGGFLGKK
jgi:hypothetical protein